MSEVVQRVVFRHLGRRDYQSTWDAMREFTDTRDRSTPDEIWLLEHPPVFTVGMNGSMAHVLAPGDTPVIRVDRGGQVTYHGPGQIVAYPLIDLRRRKMGIRGLVGGLEAAVIGTLDAFGVEAGTRAGAPGVYAGNRKIASIGLRVRRGCSYHGLAFNIDMDLEPFQRINPCGFEDLQVTSLAELGGPSSLDAVTDILKPRIVRHLHL